MLFGARARASRSMLEAAADCTRRAHPHRRFHHQIARTHELWVWRPGPPLDGQALARTPLAVSLCVGGPLAHGTLHQSARPSNVIYMCKVRSPMAP